MHHDGGFFNDILHYVKLAVIVCIIFIADVYLI